MRRAVATADVPALAELYRHPPDDAARALAAIGLERIHYNLDRSSEIAQTCERSLSASQPGYAYFCALFDNGNLRLREGRAVADAAETAIVERFAGSMPKPELDRLRDYVKSRTGEAAFTVELPGQDEVLPLEHAPGDNRGALEVAANGAKARLVVDTGASDIVLDATTARRLGVRMLGRDRRTNGFLSRDVDLEAGMLDRLAIGPVTLHHVPVWVGTSRSRLIGLDVLKTLGAFRIAQDAITVYRTPSNRPACEQPLLIASDLWGNSIRATVALSIDGTLRTVLIDSGSAFYLSADGPAMQELVSTYAHRVRLHDIGPRLHAARVGQATARVEISGQPIEMTFGVFKDAALPWHYVLGSGALGDMDFYFDFPGRHSCQLLHANLR
ncbi:hypothetical protein ASG87_05340 [Frateuria sp. Soil773]|nr:hypothetical protein ASG87_05340 [Frateuria sp. Soil773]